MVSCHEPVQHKTDQLCFDATGMLAGGTGVTPMYQVANAILKNPTDNTKITLLFANVSADDILIEEELTNLQSLSPQFQVDICILHSPVSFCRNAFTHTLQRLTKPYAVELTVQQRDCSLCSVLAAWA